MFQFSISPPIIQSSISSSQLSSPYSFSTSQITNFPCSDFQFHLQSPNHPFPTPSSHLPTAHHFNSTFLFHLTSLYPKRCYTKSHTVEYQCISISQTTNRGGSKVLVHFNLPDNKTYGRQAGIACERCCGLERAGLWGGERLSKQVVVKLVKNMARAMCHRVACDGIKDGTPRDLA